MTISISPGKAILSLVAIATAAFAAGYNVSPSPKQDSGIVPEGRYTTSIKVADCVAERTVKELTRDGKAHGGAAWQIEELGQCANAQLGGIFEKDPTYDDTTTYKEADAVMWSVLSEFMDKAVYTQRLSQHAPEFAFARDAKAWGSQMTAKEMKDFRKEMLPNGPLGSRPVDRVANAFLLADCALNIISKADNGKPSDALGHREGSVYACAYKSIGVPARMMRISDHDDRIDSDFLSNFVDMDVFNQQFNARYKKMLESGYPKKEYLPVMNP